NRRRIAAASSSPCWRGCKKLAGVVKRRAWRKIDAEDVACNFERHWLRLYGLGGCCSFNPLDFWSRGICSIYRGDACARQPSWLPMGPPRCRGYKGLAPTRKWCSRALLTASDMGRESWSQQSVRSFVPHDPGGFLLLGGHVGCCRRWDCGRPNK